MTSFRRSRPGPRNRFPVATLMAYGPNRTFATKLVVSVFGRPGHREPSAMSTWTTHAIDVRPIRRLPPKWPTSSQQHGARQTVSTDRIIGCPHEEGIDYPLGRTCPQCPFWADIDRFTHEPVTPPVPTLAPAEILEDLSFDDPESLHETLESADGHRSALVEPLLRAIDRGLADPAGAPAAEATLFCYALYLLAKWRETRAYPSVVRWLSLPGEAPFDIAGDVVTQDGGRILAAVCDGDLEPIKALIVDRNANEYGRGAGVTALGLLAAWAEVPREPILAVLLWLALEGLEREPSQVWDSLAATSADIEAVEVFPHLRRAYADGLVDPRSVHPNELDEVEAAPRGRQLEETRARYPPIDDVAEATSWWKRSGMYPCPPPGQSPIEPRQESDATNPVPAAAARSSRSVAAVDLAQPTRTSTRMNGNLPSARARRRRSDGQPRWPAALQIGIRAADQLEVQPVGILHEHVADRLAPLDELAVAREDASALPP